ARRSARRLRRSRQPSPGWGPFAAESGPWIRYSVRSQGSPASRSDRGAKRPLICVADRDRAPGPAPLGEDQREPAAQEGIVVAAGDLRLTFTRRRDVLEADPGAPQGAEVERVGDDEHALGRIRRSLECRR